MPNKTVGTTHVKPMLIDTNKKCLQNWLRTFIFRTSSQYIAISYE